MLTVRSSIQGRISFSGVVGIVLFSHNLLGDDYLIHFLRCHPTIKFTQEISLKKVPFLDLFIYKSATRFHTRLHIRPTEICISDMTQNTSNSSKGVIYMTS